MDAYTASMAEPSYCVNTERRLQTDAIANQTDSERAGRRGAAALADALGPRL